MAGGHRYHDPMLALGIDPGSLRTGWGLVRQHGSRLQLVDVGVLRPERGLELPQRLAALHAGLAELLGRHRPQLVGIESVFHGPNTRSLVVLGQARGALLAAVGAADPSGSSCTLVELSPAEIKKAVTGSGAASKDQVAHMVGALLGSQAQTRAGAHGVVAGLDATDALAVAVAALHRHPVRHAPGG